MEPNQRELDVSKFEELNKLEKSRSQREENFWRPLQDAAANTAKAFEEYLELPAKTFQADGKLERYVSLGLHDGEEFAELRPFQLPGSDWAIHFAVAVTIDAPSASLPRRRICVRCDALYDEDGLLVSVEPGQEKEARIHITGADSYQTVASTIYGVVRDIIDVQYPRFS